MTTVGKAPHHGGRAGILASYVPRLVEDVERSGSTERLLVYEGTLVSADISGFTALSERLAGLGHEGAEELTDLLNSCFGQMIESCEERGGDIVKFGGDALLVLFTEERHAMRAAAAMERMRSIVAQPWSTNSVKRVSLGISQGAHSGAFGFSLVDGGHMELLVGGPGVTSTIECEGTAGRGQILVSADMARQLPSGWLGDALPSGARPLRRGLREVGEVELHPLPAQRGVPGLERYLGAPLIEQVLAGSHGEHRQVAIAFVNVGGTDDFFHAHGALALHEACQEVAANLREVLQAHPVHLLASDAYENGAKLILTAGAPVSTDADDDHLLLAVHDLLARPTPLRLRAGVNRGHVYVGDLGSTTRRAFTVMGDAVNLAARLMQKSTAGQVVGSAMVLERADTAFECEWLEPFLVKGKSKPIEAAVVGEPLAVEAVDLNASASPSGMWDFVGRSEELEAIDRLALETIEGNGAVVEITGDAGIGKSRLVREALTRRPEMRRWAFRGGQYARNSPYFVVRAFLREVLSVAPDADAAAVGQLLRSWVRSNAPELEVWLPLIAIAIGADVDPTPEVDRLAEEFRRERLIAVVADAIDAVLDGSPAAVIAEDVHLFDSASQDVIREMSRRVAARRWLLLLVHRGGDELGFDDYERYEPIELQPLDAEAALLLARAAAAERQTDRHRDDRELERIAARAGGHPLYLLELLTFDADPGSGEDEALPESIESLVTTKIDRLPAEDRLLLREAAVAGLVIDTTLIAESFDRPELARPARWRRLDDFLEARGSTTFRFRHDLYRAVAYEGLAYRRRREAHLALGYTLERRHSDNLEPVAPLLSTHFDRAKSRSEAWRYSLLAGDTSRSTYANTEAVTMYRRALRHVGGDDEHRPETVARVAESLGDVYQLIGSYEEARGAYQRSRRANPTDVLGQARLQRKVGYLREREGQLSQALRWYTRARSVLSDLDDRHEALPEEAEIALCRAGTLNRQGRNGESVRYAELAASLAQEANDRLGIARAYNILEVAYSTLGRSEASSCAQKALEMYDGTGDLVGEANVLNNLGVQAFYAGEWDGAIGYYDRSRELRRKAGDVVGEAMASNNLAEVYSLQGRLDAARELFEQAQRMWEASSYPIGVAYVTANIAMVEARSGAVAEGGELLERARHRLEGLGATALRLEMDVRRVECLILAGDFDAAIEVAMPLYDELVFGHEGDDEFTTQLELLIALVQLRLRRFDDAAQTAVAAEARAAAQSNHYLSAFALLLLAELARREGRDPAPEQERADKLFERLGCITRPAVLNDLDAMP